MEISPALSHSSPGSPAVKDVPLWDPGTLVTLPPPPPCAGGLWMPLCILAGFEKVWVCGNGDRDPGRGSRRCLWARDPTTGLGR